MQERERITTWQKIGLMALAVCVDLIYIGIFLTGFIPVLGFPVSWTAAVWFSANVTTWFTGTFLLLGTTFISYRFFIRLMIVVTAKFIPIVSALPLWTVYVYLTCRATQKEDEEYNEEMRKVKKAVYRSMEESEYAIEQQLQYAAQMQAANDNRMKRAMGGIRAKTA